MIDLTNKGGQFYQMTQRQSQTLTGLYSTMKDSINDNLRDVGEQIVKSFDLKQAMMDVTTFTTAAKPVFMEMLTGIGESFKSNTDAVMQFGNKSQAQLEGVAKGMGFILDTVNGVQVAFKGVYAAIATATDWATQLGAAITRGLSALEEFATGKSKLRPTQRSKPTPTQSTRRPEQAPHGF